MQRQEIIDLFDRYSEDVRLDAFNDGTFVKLSEREDCHAFILLDKLLPSSKPLIVHSKHDEIVFGVDIDELAKVITTSQVYELVACGVHYDSHSNSLYKFI